MRSGVARYVAMRLDVTDAAGGIRGLVDEEWESTRGVQMHVHIANELLRPAICRPSQQSAPKANPTLVIQPYHREARTQIETIEAVEFER